MSLSTSFGLRFPRSCLLQQFPARRTYHGLGYVDRGLVIVKSRSVSQIIISREAVSRGYFALLPRATAKRSRAVRCFASESSAYRVAGTSLGEEALLERSDIAGQLQRRRLILYSKPGCCLCDGLKEKLQLAFMVGGDYDLSDIELEVRNITTNEDWENAYQYEIPVLAHLKADNTEEIIPRFSPRFTIEQLQKKLATALKSSN